MTTPAERELERQVNRLAREAQSQVDVAVVRCAQHGPQYACAGPARGDSIVWRARPCGHIACRQIAAGNCPECETP